MKMNYWRAYTIILPITIASVVVVGLLAYFGQFLISLWLAIPTVFLFIATFILGELGYKTIRPELEKEARERIQRGNK